MMLVWRWNFRDPFVVAKVFEAAEEFLIDPVCVDQVVAIPYECRLIGWGMDPEIKPGVAGKIGSEFFDETLRFFSCQWRALVSAGFSFASWGVQDIENEAGLRHTFRQLGENRMITMREGCLDARI